MIVRKLGFSTLKPDRQAAWRLCTTHRAQHAHARDARSACQGQLFGAEFGQPPRLVSATASASAGAGKPQPKIARLILRDLINATLGFEQLATLTANPRKSLHRRLSVAGNPGMDNLAAIFHAICERLSVRFEAHSVAA